MATRKNQADFESTLMDALKKKSIAESISKMILETIESEYAERAHRASNTCWSKMAENSEICDKKRKSDPTKYDRNIRKKARVEGKSYTSSKGKNIPAKHVGGSPCRLKCYEKFNEDDKLQIFQRFYSLQTKDEQDIFLQGLIQVLNIKQRRPRQSEKHKPKSVSYKFYDLLKLKFVLKLSCLYMQLLISVLEESKVWPNRANHLKIYAENNQAQMPFLRKSES
nr:unnamed protein product [Callosobruchus chinensis]